MCYSAVELSRLINKPRINNITLEILREYYEIFLNPFIFKYKILYEGNIRNEIELRFDTRNLCHLLGIESIARNTVKYSDLYKFKGIDGWDNIKNGIISFNSLKQLNLRKFKNVKAKFVYFYLLPQLIKNPLSVNYDKSLVSPPTCIECELLLYSTYEDAVIHLGIEKDANNDYYIPRTFFVEKITVKNPIDKYIINQEEIFIEKANVDKRPNMRS